MAINRWKPFQDIRRWEPFPEVENLRREMDRMFDRFMGGLDEGRSELAFIPSAEMDETSEEIHLKLEVPGLEAEDLDVSVTDDAVSIKGERQSETKTEEKGMVTSEFHYGKFERVIPLPAHVQNDRVTAEYKNGILNLTLPKAEEEKERVVKVSVV
ncbi:Hsp20/alpha crystallin family protein [Vacuolonema iberomarrocanum]|uniref:Hsp20/alpha crystallin family protein n=1 Tax=Vacuolonema iberomarrocanum TaxID=3454632 RepID=UPI0019D9F019|nr:Hsp20/alpha crystallin family protein [filamentous cyanobacterium LEGE 07170]